jgi:nicotinamidase-related amidase
MTHYTSRLLKFFRETKLPIIHIQHLSLQAGATFFIPDTQGARFYWAVKPADNETVIQKFYPNSFRETKLLSHLREENISKLVIAGMMTHMCVDATTRAAADYGLECLIAEDACATRKLILNDQQVSAADVHTAFLSALNGFYGRVMTSEAIIKKLDKGPK